MSKWLTLLTAALAVGWVPHASHAVRRSGEDAQPPLRLDIRTLGADVRLGDTLVVEYVLSNVSEGSVGGCVRDWETHEVRGSKGSWRRFRLPVDGVAEERHFLIPRGKTLLWRVDIAIPKDVGEGTAMITAELTGECETGWRGSVRSDPVTVRIVRERR